MAIAYGKGQPVEAIRALFERAEAGDYKLFVLHDADPDGYGIARTISTETRRMPGYSVDVADLGLTVATAIERGLGTEQFTRRKALPGWMQDTLTDGERDWFEGRQISRHPPQWECTRVELNAFTAPDLVAYVEAGLKAHGADGKLIPPDVAVDVQADLTHRSQIRDWVEEQIAEMFDIDTLAETLAEETADDVTGDTSGWVADAYERDRSVSWRDAVRVQVAIRRARLDGRLRTRLGELLEGCRPRIP